MKWFKNPLLYLVLGFGVLISFAATPPGNLMRPNVLAEAVANPQILSVAQTPITVFTVNTNKFETRVLMRTLQNNGLLPILYLINSTNISATNYHGVLAGGSALRDGLGSVLDLSRIPYAVTVVAESGTVEVSTTDITQ